MKNRQPRLQQAIWGYNALSNAGASPMRFHLALVLSTTVVVSIANASTINVPADQPTSQAGINAASNGDTVLVAAGTYTEHQLLG
jgi:hypothetical protein